MLKICNKKLFTILILASLFPLFPVLADGGFFLPIDVNFNEDLYEPEQKAIIFHEDNEETLMIQATASGDVSKFSWVVPVPAYPQVEQVNLNIFEEAHDLTMPEYVDKISPFDFFPSFFNTTGSDILTGGGITVYEQKEVGAMDVSILSATDANSLIEWLNNNGYIIPEKAKDVIDFYNEKKWFYVAMKIDESNMGLIKSLQQLDSRIQDVESAYTILTELIIESFGSDYGDDLLKKKLIAFKYEIPELEKIASYYDRAIVLSEYDYENYKSQYFKDGASFGKYLRKELSYSLFSKLGLGDEDKKKGLIQPIKLIFKSVEPIYPLKISSLNAGETEVLLYVFADHKKKARGFTLEYANKVTRSEVINDSYQSLLKLFKKNKYYITKLRGTFEARKLNDDILIQDSSNNLKHNIKVYEGGRVAWVFGLILFFWAAYVFYFVLSFFPYWYYSERVTNKASAFFYSGFKLFFYPFVIALISSVFAYYFGGGSLITLLMVMIPALVVLGLDMGFNIISILLFLILLMFSIFIVVILFHLLMSLFLVLILKVRKGLFNSKEKNK